MGRCSLRTHAQPRSRCCRGSAPILPVREGCAWAGVSCSVSAAHHCPSQTPSCPGPAQGITFRSKHWFWLRLPHTQCSFCAFVQGGSQSEETDHQRGCLEGRTPGQVSPCCPLSCFVFLLVAATTCALEVGGQRSRSLGPCGKAVVSPPLGMAAAVLPVPHIGPMTGTGWRGLNQQGCCSRIGSWKTLAEQPVVSRSLARQLCQSHAVSSAELWASSCHPVPSPARSPSRCPGMSLPEHTARRLW